MLGLRIRRDVRHAAVPQSSRQTPQPRAKYCLGSRRRVFLPAHRIVPGVYLAQNANQAEVYRAPVSEHSPRQTNAPYNRIKEAFCYVCDGESSTAVRYFPAVMPWDLTFVRLHMLSYRTLVG